MRKHGIVLTLLVLCLSLPGFAAKNIQKSLVLSAGEEKIVKVPGLKGISNPEDIIEDVVLNDGESIILRAISWGDTQVLVWDGNGNQITYKITVKVPKYVTELEGFLQGLEGVQVSFLGKNIIVEGQILREGDLNRLDGILNTFPQVKNMVVKDVPAPDKILLDAARAEVDNRSFKSESLGTEGILIEGTAYSAREKKSADSAIGYYFDSVYPTLNVVTPGINMEVGWVQFSVNAGSAESFAGFMTAASNQAQNNLWPFMFFDATSHSGVMNEINKSGKAGILASKNFKTKSGSKTSWPASTGAVSLYLECSPIVINDRWLDCNITFGVQQDGQLVGRQQDRLIMKRDQGIAVAGIVKRIKNSVSANVLQNLKSDPTLGPLFQDSANAVPPDLLLVMTPSWSLRN